MESDFSSQSLVKNCRLIFFSFLAVCMLLAAIGDFLFPFVFGEGYSKMYKCFILLIPGILALSTLYPLTAFYSGRNRMYVNIRGSLIALVVIVVGDIIFIPRFGINGASAVSSAGYISCQMYILNVFARENKISIWEIFIPRKTDFFWIKQLVRGTFIL